MKPSALFTAILCLALYVIQVTRPCTSCTELAPLSACSSVGCSGCDEDKSPLDESPGECSCEVETPTVNWVNDTEGEMRDVKEVESSKPVTWRSSALLEALLIQNFALPPPTGESIRVLYCSYLI